MAKIEKILYDNANIQNSAMRKKLQLCTVKRIVEI